MKVEGRSGFSNITNKKEEVVTMICEKDSVRELKIAYIGGGSRGWAWTLMKDLARAQNLSGTVYLYDIDKPAAKANAVIGNRIKEKNPEAGNFSYVAADTYEEALTGADFVVISVMPGTFDEMESDVHAGEAYGIYQSVGDTIGIGGIFRALRTLPMFFEFAEQIKQWCPDAFVINYTNPMSLCLGALYRAFPEIKCFGCCHEVFGTKCFLRDVVQKKLGLTGLTRNDIKINVLGVNHFTWITEAYYKNVDIFPLYQEFCEEMKDIGCPNTHPEDDPFYSCEKVKMDLFLKYGWIAAAGDRHLAEFCPRSWYLKDEETANKWGFNLTPVSYRKNQLKDRYAQQQRLLSGEEDIKIEPTGEEGVLQMSALLGLDDFVTNVNMPNQGQIPNLPIGTIVETNARFCSGSVYPVFAGPIPAEVKPLVDRAVDTQRLVLDAAWERDLEKAFIAFTTEQNNGLTLEESRKLFDAMYENTKEYLKSYT